MLIKLHRGGSDVNQVQYRGGSDVNQVVQRWVNQVQRC